MKDKLFKELTTREKIDFLLHAQRILIANHPASDFIFRKSNVNERLRYVKDLCGKYQGFCHCSDNILVLYNKVFVTNTLDPVATLRDHKFKAPVEHYNAVSIDFVVFRHLRDCEAWARANYDPRIQYIVFVKNGQPQIYKTEKLIAKVFHLPIAAHPVQ